MFASYAASLAESVWPSITIATDGVRPGQIVTVTELQITDALQFLQKILEKLDVLHGDVGHRKSRDHRIC